MKMNVRLVKASQFLQKFYLIMHYKPGKEHIIPDVLNRLASTNRTKYNNHYSKLDTLFTYYTMLIKIRPKLIQCISDGYLAND